MATALKPTHDAFSFFLWLDQLRRAALLEVCKTEDDETRRALARFEDGTFGDCLHCGEPIDREYLMEHPTSELCAQCQPDARVIHIGPSIDAVRTTLQEEGGRLLLTSQGPSATANDAVPSNFLEELAAGLSQSARDRLAMVIAALARVESGSFGQCVDCGQQIEQERLAEEPWIAQCEDCLPTPRLVPFRVRDEWADAIAA